MSKKKQKIRCRAFISDKDHPWISEINSPYWETFKEEDNGTTITYYQKEVANKYN